MLHSLIPPPVFQVAVLACLLLPVLLLANAWIAHNQLLAKHRLILAVAASPLFAVAIGFLFISQFVFHPSFNWTDVACAVLLYATAVMVVFSAWSLIGYGFTVSILLDATRAKVPISQDDLMQSFAGGNGLSAFVRDRASLLLRMGLMNVNGDYYTLSGFKALIFARIVRFFMYIYAIRQRELN
jgi:hypothetical protein